MIPVDSFKFSFPAGFSVRMKNGIKVPEKNLVHEGGELKARLSKNYLASLGFIILSSDNSKPYMR